MGARQSFYVESLGESSTTSATEQVKTTLTFTPDANSDYWLIASGAFTCSSTTDNHEGQVDLWHPEASAALFYQAGQVKEASSPQDWIAFFGIAKLSFAASPGQQNIDVQYWSSHSGDTTRIKDVRILVIKADAADEYAESLTQDTTTSTSYQTKTTLTFTPATTGDYLVIASAVRAGDANGAAMRARLNYVTGSLTYGDKAWYCKDDFDNQAFAVMEKLNLANASKTFRLEYRSESGTLCYIQHARILALRLDAFDNSYFASNHSLQNTTQATDQDFLTLTATPLALSHAIVAVGAYNTVSTSVSAYLNVAKDGSSLAEVVREAPNTAGWQDAGLAQQQALSAVSTTWKWRARAETAGTTVNVGNLAIAVLQLEATPTAARRRYMALAA
jgi:hypothetical protein